MTALHYRKAERDDVEALFDVRSRTRENPISKARLACLMEVRTLFNATCHCGNVEIAVSELPERLIQCTCSICRRYGSLWGHCTRATAKVYYSPGAVTAYVWGDGVIEFYHCNTCGCVTHYEGIDKTPGERLSVNFRMFSPEVYARVPIKTFDGADTWTFID